MSVRWMALLMIAACGAPAEKLDVPDLKPGAPIPWAVVRVEDDEDAQKVWRQLDPRGDDWTEKVMEIPEEYRKQMAHTFLAEERYECATRVIEDSCGNREEVFVGPTAESGLDDGCLRRKIAVWAIWNDPAAVDIEAFARMPLPERELHAEVLQLAQGSPDSARAAWIEIVEDTGDEASADAAPLDAMSLLYVKQLARHGVDSALEEMLRRGALADLARIVGNYYRGDLPRVRRATWEHVIAGLQDHRKEHLAVTGQQRIDDAIANVISGGDCVLAGAAGVADDHYRLIEKNVGNWNYMACFWLSAQGADSAFLRDWIAPGGLHADGDALANDAQFVMPWSSELPSALASCTTSECRLPGTRDVTFRTTFDDKGRLEEISRVDAGDCH